MYPNKHKLLAADLALIAIAVFWGVSFVVIKDALVQVSPANLTLARFVLTSLVLLPVALIRCRSFRPHQVLPGVLMGVFLFLAFFTQAIGLLYTLASRAGFLTGLNVVFTPLLVVLLFRRWPGLYALGGALMAFGGLYLLSLAGEMHGVPFNIGDVLNICCALAIAFHVLIVARYAPGMDSFWLTYIQFVTITACCLIWALFSGGVSLNFDPGIWAAVAFLGLFCTVAAFWTQIWAQKFIPPTRTAIIFALEPVTAAVAGFVWLDEPIGLIGAFGGGLIVAGLLLAEFKPQKWEGMN